jgi:hypothetical protein
MFAVFLQTRRRAEFVREIVLTEAVGIATAGAFFGGSVAGRILRTRDSRGGKHDENEAKTTYHDVSSLKIGANVRLGPLTVTTSGPY